MSENPRRWVVNTIAGREGIGEISVLRDNNFHGKQSLGWEGTSKIMVWSSGGPMRHKLHPDLIKRMIALAQDFACDLNEEELQPVA